MANQLLNKQGKVKYKGKWINIEDLPKGAKPDIDQANIFGTNLYNPLKDQYAKISNLQPNIASSTNTYSGLSDTSDRFSKYGLSGGMNKPGSAGRYAQSLEAILNADKGGLLGKGWLTKANLDLFATGAEAAGNVMAAYKALEAVKLGKEQIAHDKFTAKTDYGMQWELLNRGIKEKNAFLDAQGMSQHKWAPLPNAYS